MNKQIRRILIGIGFVMVVGVFYPIGGIESGGLLRAAASPEWRTHNDPVGFSIRIPGDWKVTADKNSGRIDLRGNAGEHMVIWPVFIPGILQSSAAPEVLKKLTVKVWPQAKWEMPQSIGPTIVRRIGRFGDNPVVAALTWVSTPKGNGGCLYLMSAPEARYNQAEGTFAAVLQSLRLQGPATGTLKRSAGPTYVKWSDPRENAFSLEVPSGWKVTGGLFRFASVDTRTALEAVSPDGRIRITCGDSNIPPFIAPNSMLQRGGFVEGSSYSPGYGVQMMVWRYMPGEQFARHYVTSSFARDCSNLSFIDVRSRPDTAQAVNSIYQQLGGYVSARIHTGEVSFTGQTGGKSVQGYCFAGTLLTSTDGTPGVWNIQMLYGYRAAPDQAPLGQSVLQHMVRTFQVNPQWAAMQQNISANVSKIVSRTNEEVCKIINDTYWSRQETLDEIGRRRSNANLGVEDVVDPRTGREFKVESGSNYYWVDPRGNVVGTTSATIPDIDFRALVRRP